MLASALVMQSIEIFYCDKSVTAETQVFTFGSVVLVLDDAEPGDPSSQTAPMYM